MYEWVCACVYVRVSEREINIARKDSRVKNLQNIFLRDKPLLIKKLKKRQKSNNGQQEKKC